MSTPDRSAAAAFPRYLTGEVVADSVALQWPRTAHGEGVHEGAYKLAGEPKELVVPGAGHVDLYDRVDLIPFDKLARFFSERL